MCGRFACSEIPKPLAEMFDIPLPDDLPKRDNIAPSMPVAALIRDEETGNPALGWIQWGLVPFWAKDKSIGSSLFNARAETAHVKPSFRAAFRHRRCLIPADGFYEWGISRDQVCLHNDDKPRQTVLSLIADESVNETRKTKAAKDRKVPYFITLKNAPMVFAGLWEVWHGDGGELLLSCTILTTAANGAIKPLHDRMPAILSPEHWEIWLDHRVQNRRELEHLLTPFPGESMKIEEVLL